MPNITTTLCTGCGLCCNGSLFADVELANRDEAFALEVMGLDVEHGDSEGDALLLQPCAALRGKRCSIYPYRPNCCRTFECRLLQQVKRGAIEIDQAKADVAEAWRRIKVVEKLLAQMMRPNSDLPLMERCMEALPEEPSADPAMKRKRSELRREMHGLEKLIRKTFLGP